jgi:glycine cleavage system H lipoate-binding protein
MDEELFWRHTENGITTVGLTDRAFDLFGQLWSIIPISDRKRNFLMNDPIITIEGSDTLGALSIPFNIKRINFNGDALERPDEMTPNTPLLVGEAV